MITTGIKKSFQYGAYTCTLETGVIARQASGAVLVRMGGTVVLVAAVCAKSVKEGTDFFPLTVHYQERFYSAGRLPGGFNKREGRPSTKEILTSRLIDRPLRPLFPEHFRNEVQITATVMSLDPEINSDVPAIIGASAALAVAGVPFHGPLAAARVGFVDGKYLLNPSSTELGSSQLDLVVAGTKDAILMVESEAHELAEEIMLDAVMFGHEQMQIAIDAISEFAQQVQNGTSGAAPVAIAPSVVPTELTTKVAALAETRLRDYYQRLTDKQERRTQINALRAEVLASCDEATATEATKGTIENIFSELEKRIIRQRILTDNVRIDGRDHKTVRPISIDVGLLPRAHGSVCFTRGETQAIVVATLGTEKGAQIHDVPGGEYKEPFMLHYNFPPYCTGETGMVGTPKRREIGHGNLAKRALNPIVPGKAEFPYVLRLVSEITESNGSSSMASVCGGTLALMDAGVPIKAPISGVAMGLIKEGNQFVVLTDILGDEDHFGDMDFKVAGSAKGITALQMDIKVMGITKDIMRIALSQAKEGRLHILNCMLKALPATRSAVSDFAPRIITIKIHPDKIRDVIGKGGATIRSIVEETGAEINIDDSGVVTIAAVDRAAGQLALSRVEAITAEPEVGKIYVGKVVKITDFGAFVNIMPGRDGLLHISQITNERVNRVEDYLREGQDVRVRLLEVDRQGKMRLSMKDLGE